MIWIYYYLLNGFRLDLQHLVHLVFHTQNMVFHTLNMVFYASNIAWLREIELAKLDCITLLHCLTDN